MRPDSLGLLWQDYHSHGKERVPPPVPDTGWRRPTAFPRLDSMRLRGLDIETYDPHLQELGPGYVRPGNGDERFDGHICGVSVATEDRAWYFPLRHPCGNNIDEQRVFAWLDANFSDAKQVVVGANIAYDVGWLRAYGVHIAGTLLDVQYAEALLDENAYTYALDTIAHKYLRRGKLASELFTWCAEAFGGNVKEQAHNIHRAPAMLVGPYAEEDALLPLEIIKHQLRMLKQEQLYDLFRLESSLIPLLLDMRFKGVRVDLARAEQVQRKLHEAARVAQERLDHIAGFPVNVNRSIDVAQAFEENDLWYPCLRSGRPSFRAGWLKSQGHPVAQAVLETRKLKKAAGTFVDSYIYKFQTGGYLHPMFHPLRTDRNGTVSGRFASSHPNAQNLPARDDTIAPLIRSIFVPEEGCLWRRLDYCLTGDTEVQSTQGNIRIDRLRTGNRVLSVRPGTNVLEYKPVTAAAKVGELAVYAITFEDGSCVRATADHKWLSHAAQGSRSMNWITTRELVQGTRLAHVHANYLIKGRCQLSFRGAQYYRAHLVCEAANGKRPSKHHADHIDGNVANDCEANLQWLDAHSNYAQGGKRYWAEVARGDRDDSRRLAALRIGLQSRRSYEGAGNPNYGKKRPGVGGRPTHRNNHRVASIERVGVRAVYQITVAGNHNYVLANGLVSANSQIEYRLLAHYARGPGADDVREAYNNNPDIDFHDMVTDLVHSLTGIMLDRKLTKNVNFGLCYGMAEDTLRTYLNIDDEQASAVFAAYHMGAPFVAKTYQHFNHLAMGAAEVRTILNRKRRFVHYEAASGSKGGDPVRGLFAAQQRFGQVRLSGTHKALNAVLQGSAADIIKQAMADAYYAGVYDVIGVPHVTVHDELGHSDDGTNEAAEGFRELVDIMENCVKLRVPILVSESSGANWGACK